MVGVILKGVSLPLEGYGHVVCGGPGPILMYRLGEHCVRVIVDVPSDGWAPGDRIGFLSDSYAGVLPETLRRAFVEALRAGQFHAAANELSPRVTYGSPRRVLIGDAAGHYHPLTAVGMTLGFGDALALAEGKDFHDFTTKRFQATHTPELLAMELYETFADHRAEVVAVRHAIYRRWRASSAFRDRTMRLLACEDMSLIPYGFRGWRDGVPGGCRGDSTILRPVGLAPGPRHGSCAHLFVSGGSCVASSICTRRKARAEKKTSESRDTLARAFLISMPLSVRDPQPIRPRKISSLDAGPALRNASAHLLDLQGKDGAWEGEMVWCPMLTAQYVLLHHIVERPLEPDRRRRVLRSFEQNSSRRSHMGVTRALTTPACSSPPWCTSRRDCSVSSGMIRSSSRPGDFCRQRGSGYPELGKFWLALLNLYDWRGVNAILPELWSLPRWIALHPSNWYCHTRLIYMAMAAIYPHRFQAPVTPTIASLREELFPQGFANVDFSSGRNRLRSADLYARPGAWLRASYGLARVFERFHGKRLRARCMDAIIRQIKWELQTTSHTSISPVSGLLNILALWLHDPDDTDSRQALAKLEGWIWEDEEDGTRVTGARSASWDTGFALQALATVHDLDGVQNARRRGADFLRSQQIGASFDGFREAYRNDPKGGWCFAGVWHGWPVTDCTAEAVLGILAVDRETASATVLDDAVRFMLRGQSRDGGFGSYEARRSGLISSG